MKKYVKLVIIKNLLKSVSKTTRHTGQYRLCDTQSTFF